MYEFKLPDLGEGVAEGEILKWYVEVGGEIKDDEPLVDVETDKAAVTIPSPKSGKITKLAGSVGDTVEVGSVLVVIDDGAGGEASVKEAPASAAKAAPSANADGVSAPPADGKGAAAPAGKPAPVAPGQTPVAAQPEAVTASAVAVSAPPRTGKGPVPAAPATRRLARELGIDINQVSGSGPAGRVTTEDVRLFAEGGVAVTQPSMETGAAPAMTPGAPSAIPFYELEPVPVFEQWGAVEREPIRSIRRKVARKMVNSMVTVPHVSHMDEADVTDLEDYRQRMKAKGSPSVTTLAFIIKACTVVLKHHPGFNASIDPQRMELVYKQYYNIGFAADTPRGLIVPVIKNADQLSVMQISEELRRLAVQARDGEIEVADLQGGTFTITNVGAIGGKFVIPTINYPEAAILGMGRVAEQPVIRNGEVVARKILPLCLTYDHRIVDGANGARFMNQLVRYLSEPMSFLAEM